MFCERCGNELQQGEAFCESCGAPAPTASSTTTDAEPVESPAIADPTPRPAPRLEASSDAGAPGRGGPDFAHEPPVAQQAPSGDAAATKRCPYCAEEIRLAAVVCRFCGREVVPRVPPPAGAAPPGAAGAVGYAQVPRRATNGMAIASMVLGIVWVYGIGAILALVFGYMAKSQIDASGGTQQGRGMAIAGIVLGWIGVGLLILLFLIAAVG